MPSSVLRYHQEVIVSAMQEFAKQSKCVFMPLPYTALPSYIIDGNVFVVRPAEGVTWEHIYDVDKVEALSDVYLLGFDGSQLIEHPLGRLAELESIKHTMALIEGCHGHNDLICRSLLSYKRCSFAAEHVTHLLEVSRNN